PLHARPDTLGDEGPLELSKSGQEIKDELPLRRRCIGPRLGIGAKAHAPLSELLQGSAGVRDTPEAPIEFPAQNQIGPTLSGDSEQVTPRRPTSQISRRRMIHELADVRPALRLGELPERHELGIGVLVPVSSADAGVESN